MMINFLHVFSDIFLGNQVKNILFLMFQPLPLSSIILYILTFMDGCLIIKGMGYLSMFKHT